MSDDIKLVCIIIICLLAAVIDFFGAKKFASMVWAILKRVIKAILLLAVCIIWYTSDSNEDEPAYTGYVYLQNSAREIVVGEFSNKSECEDTSDAYLHDNGLNMYGYYVCR